MIHHISGRRIGRVNGGSLTRGLEVRLHPDISVEDMAVGRYVVVEGEVQRYLGMVTDVRLEAAHPRVLADLGDEQNALLDEILAGGSTFCILEVRLMLALPRSATSGELAGPRPIKTIPSHFAGVRDATDQDVQEVFGREDETHFHIGEPLDMATPICINLGRFVARSSGIFGKSGTGKTFLTRLLLAGMIHKSVAVNLVFDMHSEYGWSGVSEGTQQSVKGLKQLFGSRVSVFSLDAEHSRQRGIAPDHLVEIGMNEVEPDDFELLRDALDMTTAQIESIHRLFNRLGSQWLTTFRNSEAAEREQLAAEFGLNAGTLNVLHRKIERLGRLPFMKTSSSADSVRQILQTLKRGRNVVLEFGRHSSLDAYILVANILTRKIHESYVEETNLALAEGTPRPRPLVITIEEAHKFLAPEIASKTIFGTIARELRKYSVTLLVVDQRPSEIEPEVMSQIGTRVTCLLDDDADVGAVLGGISGASALRSVLSRLETQQQAMILGHAVPMPVVIRTRDYGEALYAALHAPSAGTPEGDGAARIRSLFG